MGCVLVSACLLGVRCRFDGASKARAHVVARVRGRPFLAVCPEQLGGLPTPRPPQSFAGGDGQAVLDGRARVVNVSGEDVTDQFLLGARETVRLARLAGVDAAYLKARSPSCGCGEVYVDGELGPGDGVATAALRRAGVRIIPVD